MKKIYSLVIAAAIITLTASLSFAGVVGTVHDLSTRFTTETQVCVFCHAPHNGASATEGLLWNHSLSTATYTMYPTATQTNFIDGAVDAQPTGVSKLCLGCHDGTVALDAYGGAAGTTTIGAVPANLGTDLSNDHPVSILYDKAADPTLAAPATVVLGTMPLSTILDGWNGTTGKVQCSTCHDVHNEDMLAATPDFLREPIAGSVLCGKCHQTKL